MEKNIIVRRKICLFWNIMLILCAGITLCGENLIGDSSFEEMREYRPTFFQVGEYRLEKAPAGVGFSEAQNFHGGRSLELSPGAEWEYQAFDRYEDKGVFSIAIKSASSGKAEISVDTMALDIHGSRLNQESRSNKFDLESEWKRVALPFDCSVKKAIRGLYTLVIRNTGNTVLYLDAAQLELGKSVPSEYNPERRTNWKTDTSANYKADPRSDMVAPDYSKGGSGEIALKLNAPENSSGSWMAGGGVVFPRGALFDPAATALFDANGQEIEFQREALARRNTDGSIVSLLLDFPVELAKGEQKSYTLKYGVEPRKSGNNLAVNENGVIKVDTGAASFSIRSDAGFKVFEEITAGNVSLRGGAHTGGVIRTPAGVNFNTALAVPEICRIESNGPMRTVIFVAGKHKAADGTKKLDYECRIHAYKGKAYFRIDYTIINREPGTDLRMNSIGFMLPAADTGAVSFGMTGTDDVALDNGADAVLTQLRQREGDPAYTVLLKQTGVADRRLENAVADGFVSLGDSALMVRDFRERNPRALSASAGMTGVYIWPEHGVKTLAAPFGLSTTVSFFYTPSGNTDELRRVAVNAPLLQADPEWVSATEVFGRFISTRRAAELFPRFNHIEEQIFDLIARTGELTRFDGLFDYGDSGSPAYCVNHETEGVDNLWIRYLRGGERNFYNLALAATEHSRDIDVAHYSKDAAARHTHCAGVHTSYHHHAGHFWQAGLLWHYYLTGDRRSLDVALTSAAGLISRHGVKYKPGRERNRILIYLAQLYGITGNIRFREAFERQYNHGAGSHVSSTYYGGLSLEALMALYEVTGDEKYAAELDADAAKLQTWLEKIRNKKGNVNIGGGRNWHIFKAMAEYARFRNKPDTLKALIDYFFVPYSVSMLSTDYSLSTAAPLLEAMAKFGMNEPADMPERLSSTNRLAGNSTFNFVISGKEKAVVKLYKMHRFRAQTQQKYDKNKLPALEYRLTAPDGKEISSGKLDDPDRDFSMKPIELKPVSGNYSLRLTFHNDCWGAFSSSAPYRLAADRGFVFRNSSNYPIGLWLKAPRSGKLEIAFSWRYGDNAFAGKIIAAGLIDSNGTMIASRAWNVPLNYGSGSKYCRQKFGFDIPEPYRGQALQLLVYDEKWLTWQVNGLDFPWLAESKDELDFQL